MASPLCAGVLGETTFAARVVALFDTHHATQTSASVLVWLQSMTLSQTSMNYNCAGVASRASQKAASDKSRRHSVSKTCHVAASVCTRVCPDNDTPKGSGLV